MQKANGTIGASLWNSSRTLTGPLGETLQQHESQLEKGYRNSWRMIIGTNWRKLTARNGTGRIGEAHRKPSEKAERNSWRKLTRTGRRKLAGTR